MSKRAPYPGERPEHAVEFPSGHVATPPSEEALQLSRRGLLGAMAATMAVVGAEGCRRPVEKIMPYAKMPEDVIPGVASHYATVVQRRGDAVGLLVESHEGRPTKIEGNESHPSSLGAADLVAQAMVLDLYDPERSTGPRKGGEPASWADFEAELSARLAKYDGSGDQGARLRVLMQPTLSPTVLRMRAALAQRFPKTRVHTWAAVSDSNAREGARIAFGQPVTAVHNYDRARVILSLDSDFLQTESGSVRAGKTFAQGRRLRSSKDSMSRLYVVEPARTTTGANADHRLRLPASEIERYAYALAAELSKKGLPLGDVQGAVAKRADADGIPPKWLGAVADELSANRGRALVVVGSRQPPVVHALAHAINGALGSVGSTLTYARVADADELDAAADVKALTDAMAAGQVDALVIVGGNPVYDAPADLAFGEKLAKVPFTVHASLFFDETGEKCTWHVPRAHELEAWGDAQALDTTVAVQQPLIAPLYAGRSDVELLALMARAAERSGYDAVRATARATILESFRLTACGPFNEVGNADCHDTRGEPAVAHLSDVERQWNRALVTGVLHRPQGPMQGLTVRQSDVAAAVDRRPPATRVGPGGLEVTFAPCPKMVDGRHANNTWLQELPEPETKLVWDNAAIVSPATARELGLESRDLVTIAVGPRSI
ncbi:MAG TPA: molybdopterin oxidoreductase, partial [Polyangiaceae bacterium]|nr:molybdopterin oxidoreductase [Polyangiaceae bacterium]